MADTDGIFNTDNSDSWVTIVEHRELADLGTQKITRYVSEVRFIEPFFVAFGCYMNEYYGPTPENARTAADASYSALSPLHSPSPDTRDNG